MAFLMAVSPTLLLPHGGPPRSLERLLNGPMLAVWSTMLIVGSALTLIGIAWRGRYTTALAVEKIGLIFHAGACVVYAIGLLSNFDQANNTFIPAGFVFAIAVAHVWRLIQIRISVKRIMLLTEEIEKVGEQ
jgi:ABC-type Fe3+ transport system permease subunit